MDISCAIKVHSALTVLFVFANQPPITSSSSSSSYPPSSSIRGEGERRVHLQSIHREFCVAVSFSVCVWQIDANLILAHNKTIAKLNFAIPNNHPVSSVHFQISKHPGSSDRMGFKFQSVLSLFAPPFDGMCGNP